MKKQWFPVAATNVSRSRAGSRQGKAGRLYPILAAERLKTDASFRKRVCESVGRKAVEFKHAEAGPALKCRLESVLEGEPAMSKTTLRIFWMDDSHTNFIVKKWDPAHIMMKKVEWFVPEFEAQFDMRIPRKVKDALLLFVGRHKHQAEILGSVPVEYVGRKVRRLERTYRNRLTLASMQGYSPPMAEAFMKWLRENSARLTEFCFSLGDVKDRSEAPGFLWYHAGNGADSEIEIVDLRVLVSKLAALSFSQLASLVRTGDKRKIGSAIALPFGTMQYHEGGIEFRHDRSAISRVLAMVPEKGHTKFGSKPKEDGHKNEQLIAQALNEDAGFRAHFCERVGKRIREFKLAEAGGKHAKHEVCVLGGHTPGKTDVAVFWKGRKRTNVSIKKCAAGQVYLVLASTFVKVYEAQFGVKVSDAVRRALMFFTGEDAESESILNKTKLSVDGEKFRNEAHEQNHRLRFSVIRDYDPKMAAALLAFLRDNLDKVFDLCFAAGAVKDRSQWSDMLWYKNLVDAKGAGFDYLIPLSRIRSAIRRKKRSLVVQPSEKSAGSTIHLPFGHLQYHQKKLEFYQELPRIRELLAP